MVSLAPAYNPLLIKTLIRPRDALIGHPKNLTNLHANIIP